ncbi:MAG: hypothetical protein ACQCN6_11440 [Candidatus Bathyarchaeia archaeon]
MAEKRRPEVKIEVFNSTSKGSSVQLEKNASTSQQPNSVAEHKTQSPAKPTRRR